jgi:peptidoglycan/xylan/chitin deacetylase (PgdA/CDA1 family)
MAVSPRNLASSILNPIGNAVLMSRVGDLGLSHRHGARTEGRVALAFDDSPVAEGTEVALDALAEYHAPATVSMLASTSTSILRLCGGPRRLVMSSARTR